MCILIGIIVILGLSIIFSVVEHYKGWVYRAANLCEDCCVCWRLKGPSTKVFDHLDNTSNIIKV